MSLTFKQINVKPSNHLHSLTTDVETSTNASTILILYASAKIDIVATLNGLPPNILLSAESALNGRYMTMVQGIGCSASHLMRNKIKLRCGG